MNEPGHDQGAGAKLEWAPSFYLAESWVRCPLDLAWDVLLNYEMWNPTFVGAQWRHVKGEWRKPGEVQLIRKQSLGVPTPEFILETLEVIAPRRIIWYAYPVEGHQFRNFIEFGLTEVDSEVLFSIDYYAQAGRYGELTAEQLQALEQERVQFTQVLQHSADTFKQYCEAKVANGG